MYITIFLQVKFHEVPKSIKIPSKLINPIKIHCDSIESVDRSQSLIHTSEATDKACSPRERQPR